VDAQQDVAVQGAAQQDGMQSAIDTSELAMQPWPKTSTCILIDHDNAVQIMQEGW
jgi:hypothetical protein